MEAIHVSELDGRYRKKLLKGCVDANSTYCFTNPRAVAVNPKYGWAKDNTYLFYLFSWTMCANFPFPISGQMAILDRLGTDGFHWQGWNGRNQHISYNHYQASVASCPDHRLHQQQDLFCWRSPQFPWVSCLLYCIQTKSDLQTVTDRPALCNTHSIMNIMNQHGNHFTICITVSQHFSQRSSMVEEQTHYNYSTNSTVVV